MALRVDDDAMKHLLALSEWFETAKISEVKENISKCVDESRIEKWRPLVESLGLYKEGNGFTLWRLSGSVTIAPDPGYSALFFPLSCGVEISGYQLKPGEYIRFTEPLRLNAQLDFLTAIVRESNISYQLVPRKHVILFDVIRVDNGICDKLEARPGSYT